MKDDSFLLVSLKGNKAKKLAQVINNDTSRKILDYLSTRKSSTETKIAKDLGLPLSTVHYNLSALMESKLIKADEFHYSEKGKEVNHYSLANKFVIIAQQEEDESVLKKLKKLLPAFFTVLAGTGLVYFMNFLKMQSGAGAIGKEMMRSAPAAQDMVLETAEVAEVATKAFTNNVSAPVQDAISCQASEPNLLLWFLLGAIFAFVTILFWEWMRRMIKR